jgi:hypothetical protein
MSYSCVVHIGSNSQSDDRDDAQGEMKLHAHCHHYKLGEFPILESLVVEKCASRFQLVVPGTPCMQPPPWKWLDTPDQNHDTKWTRDCTLKMDASCALLHENDFRLVCFRYLSSIGCESIYALRRQFCPIPFPNVLSEPLTLHFCLVHRIRIV